MGAIEPNTPHSLRIDKYYSKVQAATFTGLADMVASHSRYNERLECLENEHRTKFPE